MGERLPGARIVEVPGVDHLPWEGDQKAVLDQIELFLGGLDEAPVEPGPGADDRARGGPAAVGGAPARLGAQPLPRPASSTPAAAAGSCARASTGRPARCGARLALADNVPALRAGIHTGECELHDGTLSGPALAVAAYLAGTAKPGEVLATSTVQDLVAGSGIDFDERGTLGDLRLFSVLR